MNPDPALFLALFAASFVAGLAGAMVGIGGGVLIVPFLALFFNVPIHYAVGASIVGVAATSSASASVYCKSRLPNLRLGVFLEAGAVVGALFGAIVSVLLPSKALEALFSLLAFAVCAFMIKPVEKRAPKSDPSSLSSRLRLSSSYCLKGKPLKYRVYQARLGLAGSAASGVVSGLFGIGGGATLVPLMNLAMGVPFRVAAATSNLMTGLTATAGAAVFLSKGFIQPDSAVPVALGSAAGSLLGSSLSQGISSGSLRILFAIIMLYTGLRMLLQSLGVSIGI